MPVQGPETKRTLIRSARVPIHGLINAGTCIAVVSRPACVRDRESFSISRGSKRCQETGVDIVDEMADGNGDDARHVEPAGRRRCRFGWWLFVHWSPCIVGLTGRCLDRFDRHPDGVVPCGPQTGHGIAQAPISVSRRTVNRPSIGCDFPAGAVLEMPLGHITK